MLRSLPWEDLRVGVRALREREPHIPRPQVLFEERRAARVTREKKRWAEGRSAGHYKAIVRSLDLIQCTIGKSFKQGRD